VLGRHVRNRRGVERWYWRWGKKGKIGSEEGKEPGRLLLCEDDAEKRNVYAI
jgi:hypothetical protein